MAGEVGPRCLRCKTAKKGCDRKQPVCGRCTTAGLQPKDCIPETLSRASTPQHTRVPSAQQERHPVVLKVSTSRMDLTDDDLSSVTASDFSDESSGTVRQQAQCSSPAIATGIDDPGHSPPHLHLSSNLALSLHSITNAMSEHCDDSEEDSPLRQSSAHGLVATQNPKFSPHFNQTNGVNFDKGHGGQSNWKVRKPLENKRIDDQGQPQKQGQLPNQFGHGRSQQISSPAAISPASWDAFVKLPAGWESATAKDGALYFRNLATGTVSTQHPGLQGYLQSRQATQVNSKLSQFPPLRVQLVTDDNTARVAAPQPFQISLFPSATGTFHPPKALQTIIGPSNVRPPSFDHQQAQSTGGSRNILAGGNNNPAARFGMPYKRDARDVLGLEQQAPAAGKKRKIDSAGGRPLSIQQALAFVDRIHRAEKARNETTLHKELSAVDPTVLHNAVCSIEDSLAPVSDDEATVLTTGDR